MKVIEHLLKSIHCAAVYNPEVQVAPVCILWLDRNRQWEAIIPRMQIELPELFVLGDYNLPKRTGPAIWLRCVLAGEISIQQEDSSGDGVKEKQARYRVAENIPIFHMCLVRMVSKNLFPPLNYRVKTASGKTPWNRGMYGLSAQAARMNMRGYFELRPMRAPDRGSRF